ncbi:MAG TPA: hypothetical protein PLQ76_08015 [bacterium]|nr:hypothetical protein [bacterium]
MKYSTRHVIDGKIEDVVLVGLDRSRDVKVYPNVTSCNVVKSEKKGNKLFVRVESVGNGDIPPNLRSLINPKMLTWIENGEFDYDTNEYVYTVKPFYFANVFSMKGLIKYLKDGEDKTIRTLDGELNIKIPLLGAIAEKKIVEIQKANLELDVKNMRDEVKELQKKRGS